MYCSLKLFSDHQTIKDRVSLCCALNTRATQPFQASDFFELNWKAVGALELNSMVAVSRSALGAFLVFMMLSPGRCGVAVNNCINEAFYALYSI